METKDFMSVALPKKKVNDIVNNYSEKGYQPGGLTVYVKKKQDSSYDVIIVNKDGQLVTAVGGNESKPIYPTGEQ